MAVPGNWTLFYDWFCAGSYSSTPMVVNADGTFTMPFFGYTGPWVHVAGIFMFTFNGLETTYAGNLASKSITGIQTTFTGSTGCFYMLQEGVPKQFEEARLKGQPDPSGKK